MTSAAPESTWQWPDHLQYPEHASDPVPVEPTPSPLPRSSPHLPASYPPSSSSCSPSPPPSTSENNEHGQQQQQQQQHKFHPPRTCRICLETVLPTFHPPSENLARVFQSSPTVTYESEDGGRLLRPCLCKGSQKYVHEACLTAWRLQNPMEKRNYWQCPTCQYSYRLERMAWGRWISSTASQLALTVAIFLVAAFLLGYVADPIINLYVDPYNTLADLPAHGTETLYHDEPDTWLEHFLKGMASLGCLGFAKFLLTLSPWQWWNVRSSGIMGGGGGRRNTGRDRIQQIGWITIIVGIVTVLVAVWKGVRAWSRKTLETFSEKVMDVPGGDNEDQDE